MEWNVVYHNMNSRKIEVYNIFDHYSFRQEVLKAMKECSAREEFEKAVNSSLMYYFWSKSEWEILIYPWLSELKNGIKVDVCWQVKNNWQRFMDYLWNCKEQGIEHE